MFAPVSNTDLSGYPYQLARDLVVGDLRDYVFFATSDTDFYLLFNDHFTSMFTEYPSDYYYIKYHLPTEEESFTPYWTCTLYEDSNNYYYNPNHYLVYSSLPGYPHLKSEVSLYAFAWSVFMLCVVFVVCFLGVTKWLYRRR